MLNRRNIKQARSFYQKFATYRKNLKFNLKVTKYYLHETESQSVELIVAIQALIAAFAVFFVTSNVDIHLQVFVVISIIASFSQILGCELRSLKFRHWSTVLNGFAVSMIIVFLYTRTSLNFASISNELSDVRYGVYTILRVVALTAYSTLAIMLFWSFYRTGAELRLKTLSINDETSNISTQQN